MNKIKYLLFILIVLATLLFIPYVANAETYTDEQQGIKWSYELDENNNIINLKCDTTTVTGEITIPSTIDGKKVISLDETFKNVEGITKVIIPDTITIIGDETFKGCSGLTEIIIPDSVVSIGKSAFQDCTGLRSVKLSNKITSIKESTFEGCSGLTSIIIPEKVTTIEGSLIFAGAFFDCTNLEKILIPDTVVSIGEWAFEDCDNLTIFGNDGMESKKYAEEHEIPFDYIANWDNEDSGKDVTAPTVKSIYVQYSSLLNCEFDFDTERYMVPTGAEIAINVNFDENIDGSTVPTLTIKFGEGKDIKLTNGSIVGNKIVYTYTVKDTDSGIMKTVSLDGGDVKDIAKNEAVLSCPTLTIENDSFNQKFVYANGTASENPDTDDSNANNNTNNTNNNNNNANNNTNNTNNNTNTNSNSTNTNNNNNSNNEQKNDTTIANEPIPHTGSTFFLLSLLGILILGCIIVYFKCKNLRDI